ncbi:MAG TPA: acetyl-CoA carboxylase biotin carboxyl carrier protein [Polyangia bacterium]|jgi:acetyl-CoA carboxylase biotin carboxyl carrier protein
MKKPKPRQKSPSLSVAAKTASGLDLGAIRELALIAEEFGLAELEADPSGRVRISRRLGGQAAAEPSGLALPSGPTIALAPPAPLESVAPGTFITSPFVGTFYRAPSPETSSFVEVGDAVKKGQVVCIVEAMKLMNEIEAEVEGKVAEVVVKNGEHVEYGQILIRLST